MKTSDIRPLVTYENRDPRLGEAVIYNGDVFLAMIANFADECDGTEDWEIEEVEA
jgi:hypothetical protein